MTLLGLSLRTGMPLPRTIRMRKKARASVRATILFVTCCFLLYVTDGIWRITGYSPSRQHGREPLPSQAIVLFWNDIHDTPHDNGRWIGPAGSRKCPMDDDETKIAECFFTTDKSKLTRASAVVVSGQHDNHLELTPLPEFRSPEQIYVFYSTETPAHKRKTKEDYGKWLSAFNWTATYRADSDVPMLYGRVEPLSNSDTSRDVDASVMSLKNSSVAAIMSNCNDRFPRQKLIQELQEAGLKVDIFGRCGTTPEHRTVCPPRRQDCYAILARHYRFFLAFENSVCKDYATEKLFKALQHPWIPIVFGGANYSHIAPPNSVIQVTTSSAAGIQTAGSAAGVDETENPVEHIGNQQYNNKKLKPSEVVELVEKLEQNETLYLSYFRWKREHISVHPIDGGCALCSKVVRWMDLRENERMMRNNNNDNNKLLASQTYADMHDWWENDSVCTY